MIEQTKKILKRYKDNLPLFSLNFKPYLEFLLSSDFLLTQRIYEILNFFWWIDLLCFFVFAKQRDA